MTSPKSPSASTPPSAPAASDVKGSLGLTLLVALVVGSTIGSGIFGLPQNMAAGAGAGAILIGWTITGVGMLMLTFVYQILVLRKPGQRALGKVTPQELSRHTFQARSMRPKVEAACHFARSSGKKAVIGSLDRIEEMLAGRAGTEVSATP